MAEPRGKAFPKGVSGNPGGRPKGYGEFKELCRSHTPEAVSALVAALMDPDNAVNAAKALLDHAWGRASQAIEVTGEGGGPLAVVQIGLKK